MRVEQVYKSYIEEYSKENVYVLFPVVWKSFNKDIHNSTYSTKDTIKIYSTFGANYEKKVIPTYS